MLEKVRIKGYQSLADVELEIGQFTVVVGESDSGKSAFIRALNGWAKNQSGSSFISHGKSKMSVTVEFETYSVMWEKPSNRFVVTDASGSTEYSKAGRSVPDEVQNVTDFTEVYFDEDYSDLVNIAQQFDSPFLLTLPGTRLAKVIGKLSGIEFVYNAQRMGNKQIGRAQQIIKTSQEVIINLEAKLAEFPDLNSMKVQLESVRGLIDRIKSSIDSSKKVSDILGWVTIIEGKLEDSKLKLEGFDSFKIPDLDIIQDELTKVGDLQETLSVIRQLEENKLIEERNLASVADSVDRLGQEIDDLLSSDLGMCPLCEQPVDNEHLRAIHA